MEFRGKEKRKACYAARDIYFECIEADGKDCQKLDEAFKEACGLKWHEHFIRRRDYEKFKKRMETEGPNEEDIKQLSKANRKK